MTAPDFFPTGRAAPVCTSCAARKRAPSRSQGLTLLLITGAGSPAKVHSRTPPAWPLARCRRLPRTRCRHLHSILHRLYPGRVPLVHFVNLKDLERVAQLDLPRRWIRTHIVALIDLHRHLSHSTLASSLFTLPTNRTSSGLSSTWLTFDAFFGQSLSRCSVDPHPKQALVLDAPFPYS